MTRHPLKKALALVAIAVTYVGVVRSASLSDDAYITLRTIDNWVNGYGLRWNIGERVQTYTHPLWMLLITPFYFFTREPYYTTLAVCFLVTAATLALVAFVLPRSPLFGALGVLALGSSHAFVAYSTSGFENPLANLLLVLFVIQLGRGGRSPQKLQRLSLLAALLLLARQDFVLLVGPAILLELAQLRSRAAVRALLIGGSPLIAWELFSFFYYGAFVPNTAAAKLHNQIPQQLLSALGRHWLEYTATNDRATALIVLLAAFASLWGKRRRRQIACVLGVAAYLGYCYRIGGDYATGRLWVAPMVFSLALVIRQSNKIVAAGLVAILLSTLWWQLRPVAFGGDPNQSLPGSKSVWDDHHFYFVDTSLLRLGLHARGPLIEWGRWGAAEATRPDRVVLMPAVGQYGYYSGPRIHVVDNFALGDPLLARLRPNNEGDPLPGHLVRTVPAGYLESVGKTNVIRDPDLKQFYDVIVEVTRGPLWSWSRLDKAIGLMTGRYQPLLDRYEQRNR